MDKTIHRIKLSTEKDEHGSFYSIIFENQIAYIRFHDGRTSPDVYAKKTHLTHHKNTSFSALFEKFLKHITHRKTHFYMKKSGYPNNWSILSVLL